MIQDLNDLHGYRLAASDGDIGHIADFFFDDRDWVVRYLVADLGSWLDGRQVLLTPHAFGHFDQAARRLPVRLTRDQIERSPAVDLHQPVSRRYEVEHYRHYGLPSYWDGGSLWGVGAYPLVLALPAWGRAEAGERRAQGEDRRLRSVREVTGYAIRTADGDLGKVCGFLVDDTHWVIKELIVETGHWYAGRRIRLLPEHIERIDYAASVVLVRLTKEDIDHTTAGGMAHPAAAAP